MTQVHTTHAARPPGQRTPGREARLPRKTMGVPASDPPHPLALEALAGGGAALAGVPTLLRSGGAGGQAAVRTLGHLMKAGVLPLLPPRPREQLQNYLHRVTRGWTPEGFHLKLEPYLASGELVTEPAEEPGLYVLKLSHSLEPTWINSHHVRVVLNRLHPMFFGSLMVHLSRVSHAWPVHTVYDALDTARLLRYDGADDFSDYWKFLKEDFYRQHDRVPRGSELREYAQPYVTPRCLFKTIGLDEVLPALKRHLRLSQDDLYRLAKRSDRPGGVFALKLLDLITELRDVNNVIHAEMTDDECTVRAASGESRLCPIAAVSGQRVNPDREWHEVYELLLEDQQLVDAGQGYCEPFTLLIRDEAGALHAARMLKLLRQSLDLTTDLLGLLEG